MKIAIEGNYLKGLVGQCLLPSRSTHNVVVAPTPKVMPAPDLLMRTNEGMTLVYLPISLLFLLYFPIIYCWVMGLFLR